MLYSYFTALTKQESRKWPQKQFKITFLILSILTNEIKIPRSSCRHRYVAHANYSNARIQRERRHTDFPDKGQEEKWRRKAAAMETCCILRLRTIKFVINMMEKDKAGTLLFCSLLSLLLQFTGVANMLFLWDNTKKKDFREGREIHLTKCKEREQR